MERPRMQRRNYQRAVVILLSLLVRQLFNCRNVEALVPFSLVKKNVRNRNYVEITTSNLWMSFNEPLPTDGNHVQKFKQSPSSSSSSSSSSSLLIVNKRQHEHQQEQSDNDHQVGVVVVGESSLPLWKLAVAGMMATFISDVIMHPVDCIKTLQQSDEGIGLSLVQAVHVIHSQLGLEGFYKGFVTYAGMDATAGAIKFATYELSKRCIENYRSVLLAASKVKTQKTILSSKNLNNSNECSSGDNETSESTTPDNGQVLWNGALFACAAIACVTSSVVTVPAELIKQHLQMGHYNGNFLEAVSTIWETSKIQGFYVGYDGVLLRDIPYTAIELGLYDLLKTMFMSYQKRQRKQQNQKSKNENSTRRKEKLFFGHTIPSVEIFAAAATGGIGGYVTTPLDTTKTKIMIDYAYSSSATFWQTLITTLDDHGYSSVFAGGTARVAWLVPLTAIYLPTYDFLKRQFAIAQKTK